ncbi:Glycosyl transferase family 2 [Croceitalea dokdonensis DOKDO 023]|uniref:Glycosyl transferase family 2 n=1 Tax=Croceitalea dokdonensis DOKDO 023 TaxID=1300341 RepID=A0A0P7AB82_9FLAO|nr:glycosyltransferase family 2 protein [Croceitalea dokdonensis]KPM30359.1 Glycosyl transferase family 2 [Croceitalea dokdonensis DOKDO 023]
MTKIAILLTCFNRKQKTLACLSALNEAIQNAPPGYHFTIYLTDDGSTDGTGEAVISRYPKINVLQGTGNLYWAGGMRHAWQTALSGNYDGFLLLNDDTLVFEQLFLEMDKADAYCLERYGKKGIYLGSTQDSQSKKMTYGGAKLTNRFLFKYHFLPPNGSYQACELGNANIMYVSKEVVEGIGILSTAFVHGVADYDYTLLAVKKGYPVLSLPEFTGFCEHDHKDIYEDYHTFPFKKRWDVLHHPLGLDFASNLNLMKRHFPLRIPFVALSAGLKLFLPTVYHKSRKHR